MKIYIKNMVSKRCNLFVMSLLKKLEIRYKTIHLGEVELTNNLNDEQKASLKKLLLSAGLELMDDKKRLVLIQVEQIISEILNFETDLSDMNLSEFLSKKMGMDYPTISHIFSETKGITIEHFIIVQKIEKAKELMMYDDLSVTDIAFKLNYSSTAHLSNQFKKITGLTPTFFKAMKAKKSEIAITKPLLTVE